jgi:hypothetical protein
MQLQTINSLAIFQALRGLVWISHMDGVAGKVKVDLP